MMNKEFFVTGMRPNSETRQLLNAGFVSERDAETYLHRRIREKCKEVAIQSNVQGTAADSSPSLP